MPWNDYGSRNVLPGVPFVINLSSITIQSIIVKIGTEPITRHQLYGHLSIVVTPVLPSGSIETVIEEFALWHPQEQLVPRANRTGTSLYLYAPKQSGPAKSWRVWIFSP